MENQLLILLLLISTPSFSQNLSRQEYIDIYKSEAIYQMKKHNIPASITMAQALLESANGNSELAKKSNNHFGIKCHSNWQGERVYHDDDKSGECFRKYSSVRDSYDDHSIFLLRERYSNLFELSITDYKSWAKGLKKAGYATDPAYAKRLIQIIEDEKLNLLDNAYEAKRDQLVYSGFMLGWKDIISQTYVYQNITKEFYMSARISASYNDMSVMFGGGKLISQKLGVGLEVGPITKLGQETIDFHTNFSLSSYIIIPIKNKKLTFRLSLSTLNAKTYYPSISFGFLR